MGPGGMMPVAGVGVEGGFLAPGMVPVGFDGGLQQQQRKRSGNSSDLEGLKPTKSVKVRPASYKLLMIQHTCYCQITVVATAATEWLTPTKSVKVRPACVTFWVGVCDVLVGVCYATAVA
jgi:cysteine synthase